MLKQLQSNTLYTNNQIAEWFGLKAKKFSNKEQKERKLEQLKIFADYELVGDKTKKIYIKEVYNPIYSKLGSRNQQIINDIYESYWSENGRGLDTCERVGTAIYKDNRTSLTYKSTVNYVGRSKRKDFGKNYMNAGLKGHSIYAWGKYIQDGEEIKLIPLTKEQEEIKNKLIKKYFGDTTDKQIFVQGMVDNGEISKEQAWDVLDELTNMSYNFKAFKADFEVAINSAVGRGTYLIPDFQQEEKESAF